MCRLLYLPQKVARTTKILKPWLRQLEESNGGHGNGLATMSSGVKKGIDLSTKACARMIGHTTAAVVWHTRRASCGLKVSELCHPFETGSGFLVHNGHWEQGAFGARLLKGHWSDSRVAALYCQLYGWDAFTHECNRGVWLHLVDGGCQVHYKSGQLYVEMETGALCSEPSKQWGHWLPAKLGTYKAGEAVAADLKVRLWDRVPGNVSPPLVSKAQPKSDGGIRPAIVFKSQPKVETEPEPADEPLDENDIADDEGVGIDDKTGRIGGFKNFDEWRFARLNGYRR